VDINKIKNLFLTRERKNELIMSHHIFPIVSNLAFLFSAVAYFSKNEYLYAFVNFLIPFTSGSFHACDEGFTCIFSFMTHKSLDYIFAILIIPLTFMYFVKWEEVWYPLKNILIVTYAFLIALMVVVQQDADSLVGAGIVAASAFLIPVIYWIGYAIEKTMHYPAPKCCSGLYFPKYEWGAVLAGTALSAIGVYLFISQSRFVYGWTPILHSLWHIMAALGQVYVSQIKATVSPSTYCIIEGKAEHITPDLVTYLHNNVDTFDKNYPIEFVFEQ
jgi:hypothetical protein